MQRSEPLQMFKFFRRAAWLRTLPFAVFMAWLVVRGEWPSLGVGGLAVALGLDARWLYAAGTLCVALLLAVYWREYGELSRQRWPSWREAACALGAGTGVFALWIMLDEPWMRFGTPAAIFRPVDAQGELIWSLLLIRWFSAVLVVPLMEELFWRSFLMRWLQAPVFDAVAPHHVGVRALVLSTFVFMLAHTLWLAAIVAGVVYAWLYIRSGKLWLAVIAHAVTNGLLGVWVVLTGNWGYW